MENVGLGIALGFLIGTLSGIFGVSGGIFAVPMLGLLHFDEHLAQGTSLVMQLPLCIVGLWQYARRGTLGGSSFCDITCSRSRPANVSRRNGSHVHASCIAASGGFRVTRTPCFVQCLGRHATAAAFRRLSDRAIAFRL